MLVPRLCLRWRCGRISVELLVERWQKEDEIAEVREPVKSFFLLFLLMCIPTGSVLRLSGVRATNDLPAWSIEWEPGRIDRRLAHLCSFAQYATLPALSANSIEVFDSNKSHTHTHTHTHHTHTTRPYSRAPSRALSLSNLENLRGWSKSNRGILVACRKCPAPSFARERTHARVVAFQCRQCLFCLFLRRVFSCRPDMLALECCSIKWLSPPTSC